jgi:hypothetical protein
MGTDEHLIALRRHWRVVVAAVILAAQETAFPPGYHEYFRRVPELEEQDVGETPPYRVRQKSDTV